MSSSRNTSADFGAALAALETQFAAAQAAPLSRQKAMIVALLIDDLANRLFAAAPEADDILVFRSGLAAASPALALVFALAALQPDGARLVTEAVEVPLAEYSALTVEDFMVSLYNDHSVQRVLIAAPDGERHDALAVLGEALAALKAKTLPA